MVTLVCCDRFQEWFHLECIENLSAPSSVDVVSSWYCKTVTNKNFLPHHLNIVAISCFDDIKL